MTIVNTSHFATKILVHAHTNCKLEQFQNHVLEVFSVQYRSSRRSQCVA